MMLKQYLVLSLPYFGKKWFLQQGPSSSNIQPVSSLKMQQEKKKHANTHERMHYLQTGAENGE